MSTTDQEGNYRESRNRDIINFLSLSPCSFPCVPALQLICYSNPIPVGRIKVQMKWELFRLSDLSPDKKGMHTRMDRDVYVERV